MIYRVEIRKDGSIASCDVVESMFTPPGGRVFYVDAHTKTDACAQAKKRWESLQAAGRKRLGRAVELGLCRTCARNRARPNRTTCSSCFERESAAAKQRKKLSEEEREIWDAQRKLARIKNLQQIGKAGGATTSDINEKKADDRWDRGEVRFQQYHLGIFRQCLRAYDRNPAGFRDWLLAKLGQKESTAAE